MLDCRKCPDKAITLDAIILAVVRNASEFLNTMKDCIRDHYRSYRHNQLLALAIV